VASGVGLLSHSREAHGLGESLHQSLCVLLDKRVSVLKLEIGYGESASHLVGG
jgi:hypothetical protein